MSMVFCPECGSRISSTAVTCPHCGFHAQGTGIVPISALPPAIRPPALVIPDASVFDDGSSLVTREVSDPIVRFLSDAEVMEALGSSRNRTNLVYARSKAKDLMLYADFKDIYDVLLKGTLEKLEQWNIQLR